MPPAPSQARPLAALLLFCASLLPLAAPAEPAALVPGETAALTLAPGQTLRLPLAVSPGQALRVQVDEQGVDAAAALVGQAQRWPAEDDDILRWGSLRLAVAAAEAGLQLELRAPRLGSPPATVKVRLENVDLSDSAASRAFGLDLAAAEIAQRFADPRRVREPETARMLQSLCAARREAGDEAGLLRCVGVLERVLARQQRRAEAVAALEQVLPLWRRSSDRRGEASALNNLAMHHNALGDGRLSRAPLRQALAVLDGVDDNLLRAVIQNNLCLTGVLRDSLQSARTCYEEALALSLASGDEMRIATALNNLGGAYLLLGDASRAADLFSQAIARRRQFDDQAGSADPLQNLALTDFARGRYSQALRGFEQSGAAYRSANDRAGEARTLRHRGHVQLVLGEPARAIDLMQQALELQRQAGRRSDMAKTLSRLAEAQLAEQQFDAARASAREAAEIAAVDADPAVLADVWLRTARVQRRSGDLAGAGESARQAEALARKLEQYSTLDQARLELAQVKMARNEPAAARRLAAATLQHGRLGQVFALEARNLIAAALRAQGRKAAAEQAYREALAAIENAGSYVYDLELRAIFLATQREAQRGLLALLLESDGAGPARAAEALVLSERLRARSLRERLDAAPAPPLATAEREQHLARLAELGLARWKLQEDRATPARLAELDVQIRAAEAALRSADAAAQESAALPPPGGRRADLAVADLQQALPAEASLVVYRQLPQQSYAWVLSRDRLHAVPLADENELGQAVREVRAALAGSDTTAAAAALEHAHGLLWQPLAPLLKTPRVFVVADASLDALPFAALRPPAGGYLLQQHEISLLPAAWLLLRPPPPALRADYRALLVGDPVYTRDDPRLGVAPEVEYIAAAPVLRNGISRLRGSRDEVQRVQYRLGAAHSTVLQGLDASLPALQEVNMGSFDLLHFATHGVDGRAGISGSGLVLSLFDAQGRSADGFLSSRRIGAGRLDARLVVLGACDTAVGRAIGDEGSAGVAHAFLQAGARHVVATLWPVQDGVMPELMTDFYADPALSARRPAQALRQAQLRFLQRYPQASPALWAGVEAWGW
ncbi:CHAT domain-containing tetratricopeptide repeat protein [Tahibacter harae]|uniref:CHAT domain-containing protein n=1 Tax=Tahibacter harae TaxID=2963937 RepID=A0ABT1QUA0_9GAMM|nr:CHAT domain-containing protein [Tahibacter harae]MCQ4165870.1 CHAT domain-containing protein [Tahibacter harae]